MVSTAVLVSGGGTNLQALLDARTRGELSHVHLTLVVSDRPDTFALERARRAGIPSAALYRRDHPDTDSYDRALLDVLRENGVECVVMAGFLTILGRTFVAAYRDRILNVHPALIPSFCGRGMYGLRVHRAALDCGVKVTGATVHLVDEVPDGGKILLQKAVDVLDSDTPETLQRRVMEQAEWILLPQALEMCCTRWEERWPVH